jgi:hypothetical protein
MPLVHHTPVFDQRICGVGGGIVVNLIYVLFYTLTE